MLKFSKPKTRKQLHSFICMINYYCDMWQKQSEALAPLTELMSVRTLWEWKEKTQQILPHNKNNNQQGNALRVPRSFASV